MSDNVTTLDHVDAYLKVGQDYEASDIHLPVNSAPHWRRHGSLTPIWEDAERLTAADTERLAKSFLGPQQLERLEQRGDVDFAYANSFGRFRASVVQQRLGYDMAFRIINTEVRTMEDLNLPKAITPLTQFQNGLVLVTGSVGSGKSTTLAAMVDGINKDREDHIITLEDPIEYIIGSKSCHVNQREVHTHRSCVEPGALRTVRSAKARGRNASLLSVGGGGAGAEAARRLKR